MSTHVGQPPLCALPVRAALLYVVWVALAGTAPLDLAIGVPAAALAAWISLPLLPPGHAHLSPRGLLRLAMRFPGQSLAAGIDVARRAFDPRVPVRPGYVACPTSLPAGLPRDAFLALTSVQPGSLPVAEQPDGTVLVHTLDTFQPIAARFAAEEAAFRSVIALEPAGTGGMPHG